MVLSYFMEIALAPSSIAEATPASMISLITTRTAARSLTAILMGDITVYLKYLPDNIHLAKIILRSCRSGRKARAVLLKCPEVSLYCIFRSGITSNTDAVKASLSKRCANVPRFTPIPHNANTYSMMLAIN